MVTFSCTRYELIMLGTLLMEQQNTYTEHAVCGRRYTVLRGGQPLLGETMKPRRPARQRREALVRAKGKTMTLEYRRGNGEGARFGAQGKPSH